MKRISKLLLLVTLFACLSQYAWSQASTEGKEFWVGLTLTCRPPDSSTGEATPYLAISTKEATNVTITNPAYPNANPLTYSIPANQWYKITDIPLNWWYPSGVDKPSAVGQHADKVNKYGIHVQSDVNVSVFAVIRAYAAMDASNILPISAIQSEYILQDYIPTAKPDNSNKPYFTMATIVATEDNTEVEITPSCKTYNGTHAAGVKYTVPLQKGETYYLIAENDGTNSCLSGTYITEKTDKKIAVFQGTVCTFLPAGVGNRDCLYEQAMPVVYWGTRFVATRSYAKGAVMLRVTASTDGTNISVGGYPLKDSSGNMVSLKKGQTYEIQLAASNNINHSADVTIKPDYSMIGDHAYIETTCPVAIYSYDVGKNYEDRAADAERDPDESSQQGDASSVWIAPIEQAIDQITFGPCGTNLTTNHYLDIVVKTAYASQTVITPAPADAQYNPSTSFIPVDGNPTYSYARIYLAQADERSNASFTVSNPGKFVAHVYGNGQSESYAYSAGSAAVEQGVIMDGETFTNGYRSDTKFCIGTEFIFDAKVGTDEITRVDWNFGDGTTQYNGEPVTTHTYNTPGWYDATAKLYGHQACAEESEQDLGTVSFTFRVWRHDTVIVAPTKKCLTPEEQADTIREKGQEYLDYLLANPSKAILNPDAPCYEDRQLSVVTYGLETTLEKEEEGRDSVYVNEQWYYADKDPRLPADGIIEWIEEKANRYNCDRHVTCHAKIITCLDIDIQQTQLHTCLGENLLVNYTKYKGDIDGKAVLTIAELPSYRKEIDIPQANISGTIDLPIADLKDPGYYTGIITIHDVNCSDQTLEFTIPIVVYYPADIFVQKFNNVLAVYAPGNGGNKGYTFTGYQWYRNGEAIQDATGAVYHSENPLEGIYYVVLTNSQNVTLPSCEQEVYGKSYMPSQAPAAQKKIVNQRICIVIDNRAYDVYGQRVE